jgi:hypothetical protein
MSDATRIPARLEQKFLVSEATARALTLAIAPFCHPDENTSGPYTLRTLYFDTRSREFHQAKLRRDHDRVKLRARAYGDFTPGEPVTLELKRKTGVLVRKTRVLAGADWVAEALGRDVPPPFEDAVTAERRERLDRFAYVMVRKCCEPAAILRYRREAFVSHVDAYARVTFDRDLMAYPTRQFSLDFDEQRAFRLDGGHASGWAGGGGMLSPVLLELKCERLVPEWMASLVRAFQLSSTGFSKYSQAMDTFAQRSFARPTWSSTYA